MWTGKPTDDIKKLLTNKFNTKANDFCEYNPPFTTAIIPTLFKIAPTVASEIIIALWEVKSKEISVIFLRSSIFIATFFKLNVFLEMPNLPHLSSNFTYVGMLEYFRWDMILLKLQLLLNTCMNATAWSLVADYKEINESNYISRSADKKGFGWIVIILHIIIRVSQRLKYFSPSNWTYRLVKY